jgi:hypothetical protein
MINRSTPLPMYIPRLLFSRVRTSARGRGARYPGAENQTPRDAGGRTRTSKGREAQRDLNPPRLPVPPRPPRLKDRADGYERLMSDQADRERESRESDITKFEEIRQADEEERLETAQRLQVDRDAAQKLEDEQQPEQNEP